MLKDSAGVAARSLRRCGEESQGSRDRELIWDDGKAVDAGGGDSGMGR